MHFPTPSSCFGVADAGQRSSSSAAGVSPAKRTLIVLPTWGARNGTARFCCYCSSPPPLQTTPAICTFDNVPAVPLSIARSLRLARIADYARRLHVGCCCCCATTPLFSNKLLLLLLPPLPVSNWLFQLHCLTSRASSSSIQLLRPIAPPTQP